MTKVCEYCNKKTDIVRYIAKAKFSKSFCNTVPLSHHTKHYFCSEKHYTKWKRCLRGYDPDYNDRMLINKMRTYYKYK